MNHHASEWPQAAPYDTRRLPVDALHTLYVEQVGTPDGIPAVYLHGGPGSGCQPSHRRLFDPARFRTVLFDQRGAGRSTPKRDLRDNTTDHLIADMERVRQALGIDRWMVAGGSWGALLAVAYAQAHPERVSGLVLRAVFLGESHELEWAFIHGPQTFYPELWRQFVGALPHNEQADPVASYGARLDNPDPAVQRPAAQMWHDYEQVLSVLSPSSLTLPSSLEPSTVRGDGPNTPYVEWHYFKNGCFLGPEQLLRGAGRLAGIPGIIVQGRYDLLCPPTTAHALAERWDSSELRIVNAAGHSLSEPAVGRGVITAIDELARRIG